MGLLDFNNPYAGYASMGMDPKEMQRKAIFNTIAQLGIGLLSGKNWGQGIGQGLLSAQQAGQQAQEDAMRQAQFGLQQQEATTAAEKARIEQEQMAARQKAVQDAIAAGQLPPEQAALAQAFPEEWGKQQLKGPDVPGSAFAAWYQDVLKTTGQPPNAAQINAFRQADRPVSNTTTNVNIKEYGTPPEGWRLVTSDPAGIYMEPIPGGPVDMANKTKGQTQQKYGAVVVDNIQEAKKLVEKSPLLTTGLIGSIASQVPGSPGYDLKAKVDTIKANVGFDRLAELRASSPTGAAVGQVTEKENAYMQAALGSLDNAQSKDQFLNALGDVERIYQDIVSGKSADPNYRPVFTKTQTPTQKPAGTELYFDENGNQIQGP